MGFSSERYPNHNPLLLQVMHAFHVRFHVITRCNMYPTKPRPRYMWHKVKEWLAAGYTFKECMTKIEKRYPIENNYAMTYEKRERRSFLAGRREIDYSGVDEGF